MSPEPKTAKNRAQLDVNVRERGGAGYLANKAKEEFDPPMRGLVGG